MRRLLVVSFGLCFSCAAVEAERIPFAQALGNPKLPRAPKKKKKAEVALAADVSPELQAALLRLGNTLRAGRRGVQRGAPMPAAQTEAWGATLAEVDGYAARPAAQMSPFDLVRARVVLEAELEEDAALFGDFPGEVAERTQKLLGTLKARQAELATARLLARPVDLKRFTWPLSPVLVSSPFGYRFHPLSGDYKQHKGVDLVAEPAQPVYAPWTGTVVFSGWSGAYGKHVEVQHDGRVSTTYSHLLSLLVREGEVVKKGQLVGLAGETGNATGVHLHFELLKDGHPVDPEAELPPYVDLFRLAAY